ncbi:MAG: amino acid permease [Planctomycetota bacterium]|nr:MAG: amino acid permease [Planctomycetota bacterium]
MSTRRTLGFTSATALVVANMVGTGVFTTSGFLLASLGNPVWVLAVWALGGLLAGLGALCYGSLARLLPESGGEYLFLSRTLHPAAGWLAGWVSLVVGFAAPVALNAHGFGEYLQSWFPALGPKGLGTALIILVSLQHWLSVREGARFQTFAVLFKIALILGFVACAFFFGGPRWASLQQELDQGGGLAAFGGGLILVSFSYAGYNAATYIGGEVRNPKKNLPWALLAGTALVVLLYLTLNGLFLALAPAKELSGQADVGRIAAASLDIPAAEVLISLLIALALYTSASAMTMIGPRIYAQMARDGWLWRGFLASEGPPRRAILLQSGLALVMLWSSTFLQLLSYVGFTLSLSSAATVFGLILIRRRRGAEAVPVFGWPLAPLLFLAFTLYAAVSSILERPLSALLALLTLGVGFLLWWRLYADRSKVPGDGESTELES